MRLLCRHSFVRKLVEVSDLDRRRFLEWTGVAPLGLAAGCSGGPAAAPGSRARGISTGSADCWIDVDLDRIGFNLAQIRARVGGRPVMAVIKANAYGHGLVEVGRYLVEQGVVALAVGKLAEAIELRAAGVRGPILNLGPLLPDHAADIVLRDVTQTVYTDEVATLARVAVAAGKKARVQVNVDTGLGRVGVPHDAAVEYLQGLAQTSGVKIEGAFTALTEDPEFDAVQLRRFLAVCDRAKEQGISIPVRHAASSAACLAMPEAHLDMVRPGIALYGHYPSDAEAVARKIELRPAMQLAARVSYVKTLQPGASISYHKAFVAKQTTRVATLAIGYSDGYPHRGVAHAEVLVGGRRCRVIALVTANHTTVDVTDVAKVHDVAVAVGDTAVLFGEQGDASISATEVAKWSSTSVYKTLIETSSVLPRRY